MAKEWLSWVRNTIGYKDPSLTEAHYEKLCRNSAKDIFKYLQEHIKTEEDVRMIKENLELFGMEDTAPAVQKTKEPSMESTEEELSRTLLEIQLAEERIKKLESGLAKKGAERKERSNEVMEVQRKTTLLQGAIKDGEKELDEIDDGVRGLEAFSTACLLKKAGSKRIADAEPIQCAGCKKAEASVLLGYLAKLVGESKGGSADSQSKTLAITGARDLLTHHTADCLMKAFIGCCGTQDVSSDVLDKKDGSGAMNVIEVLQQDFVQLVKELGSVVEQREHVEKVVEVKKQSLIESALSNAPDSSEDLRIALNAWVDAQLDVAGKNGVLRWLIQFDQRSAEDQETLEKEKSALKKAYEHLQTAHLQLEKLDSELSDGFGRMAQSMEEWNQRKAEAEQVLLQFITNYTTAISLYKLLALSDPESEKSFLSLTATKPVDFFRTGNVSGGFTLADVFVPNTAAQSSILALARHGVDHPLAPMLKSIWEQVESSDGIGKVSGLLDDLQDKDANIRSRAIADLMSKLKTGEKPLSDLQTCLQRLRESFMEWAIEEAEGASGK